MTLTKTWKSIIWSISAVAIMSTVGCKKEPSSSAIGNETYEAQMAKKNNSPACACPEFLILDPNDGVTTSKLNAFLKPDSMPDKIGVKGTTDINKIVGGTHPKWKSRGEYITAEQTLVLYLNGVAVRECSYRANGAPNPVEEEDTTSTPPVPAVEIANFQVSPVVGGVKSSWTSTVEVSVDYYILDRSSGGAYDPIQAMIASGSGSYYFYDDITDPGTYTYRARAVLSNGTEVVFPGATITIN